MKTAADWRSAGVCRAQFFVPVVFAGRLGPEPCNFLAIGLLLRPRFSQQRENPEPRYTLECYPAVLCWFPAPSISLNKFPFLGERLCCSVFKRFKSS